MKKILLLFISLLLAFVAVWVMKSKTPSARPDSYALGLTEVAAWYDKEADTSDNSEMTWRLDPEIPDNYIPVPGADELYMVVDENGNILGYRHRTQQEDGTWVWEDVNPDIPEGYEPVEGLDNVYKVTYEDGTVRYFKYIRNPDDTFAFIEVDENGNPIGYDDPEGEEIPENYEHIGENVYAVKNEAGIPVMFKLREMDKDGNYQWSLLDVPDTLFTEMGSLEVPPTPALMAVNEYFTKQTVQVPVGIPVPVKQKEYVPYYSGPVTTIQEADGSYTETETYTETVEENGFTVVYVTTITRLYDINGNLISTKKEGPVEQGRVSGDINLSSQGNMEPSTLPEVTVNSETGIPSVQSSAMPQQTQTQPQQNTIASTLPGEFARVSVGVSMDQSITGELLAKMNTERVANGLGPLTLDTSGEAYQLAMTRAAAMASNHYNSNVSPLYGTLTDMCNTYGVVAVTPLENTWQAEQGTDANTINASMMSDENMKQVILTNVHSCVGIGVAIKDGYMYISEVLIN